MSDWRPNFHWITDDLAVGGSFAADDVPRLAHEHGIGAVVDLREEAKDDELLLQQHGITLLHLPTEDMCGVDAAHLDEGVRFACEQIERGVRVLVHCQHGIGRSAVLGLCVMVRRGHAPLQALGLMKDRRALVSPSPDQFECWCGWLERQRRASAAHWTIPTFDEFAKIAYRHLERTA
jgi:protein tyrosine phosphatase (PTP) superfamily phosphohydrolase (DUF442 family)